MDYDVYLLDDPLSAVDAVVAHHIFERYSLYINQSPNCILNLNHFRCICGLLKDRLVVLVTHQLHFAEQADRVLALNDVSFTDVIFAFCTYASMVPSHAGKDGGIWQCPAAEGQHCHSRKATGY